MGRVQPALLQISDAVPVFDNGEGLARRLRTICKFSLWIYSYKYPSVSPVFLSARTHTPRLKETTIKMATHADIELIPGTEVMNADGKADKSLIPRPSSDPRDPLNWSMPWKRTCSL